MTIQRRAVDYLNSKMGWPLTVALLGMTAAGAYQMRFRRLRKMMISNGTFCCLVLAILALAVKIRHSRKTTTRSIKKE